MNRKFAWQNNIRRATVQKTNTTYFQIQTYFCVHIFNVCVSIPKYLYRVWAVRITWFRCENIALYTMYIYFKLFKQKFNRCCRTTASHPQFMIPTIESASQQQPAGASASPSIRSGTVANINRPKTRAAAAVALKRQDEDLGNKYSHLVSCIIRHIRIEIA